MNEQESNEEKIANFGHQEESDPIVYVYIPDEGLNGFLIKEGAYASTVQYFDNGVGYVVEMLNEDFVVVDEINIGHIDETDKNL
jgi:hypothetical protein